MKAKGIKRYFRHLVSTSAHMEHAFPHSALKRIESAIAASEKHHAGEIRFVVENCLNLYSVLRGKTPKQRAMEIFSQYRVWDTAQNNGVLIYLCLADKDVEILADRGIDVHVGDDGWNAICNAMEVLFRKGQMLDGVLLGVEKIGEKLREYFPLNVGDDNENELSNKPLVL